MSFQSRLIHTAAVIALTAAGAAAQTPAAHAGPPPNKIAVVDIRQAIQSTGEGKQASGELQSQFSARQSELENLQKSIEDLQGRLSAGARLSRPASHAAISVLRRVTAMSTQRCAVPRLTNRPAAATPSRRILRISSPGRVSTCRRSVWPPLPS